MKTMRIMVIALAITLALITVSQADPLDSWHLRYDDHTNDMFTGIAFGTSNFVVVGHSVSLNSGIIMTSPDGLTWTSQPGGAPYLLYGVTYGNGHFVAVGRKTSVNAAVILTSPDGSVWTERVSGTSFTLMSVTFANGRFITVGFGGTILTSSDGVTWAATTSGTSFDLYSVAYGNGRYVAVGYNTLMQAKVLTSPDGFTWSDTTPTAQGTPVFLSGVAFGAGMFVVVGEIGKIMTSPDGAAWTSGKLDIIADLRGIMYGNATFVAVGEAGKIVTSPDGVAWTKRISGTTSPLYTAAYGNSTVITAGWGPILQSDPVTGYSANCSATLSNDLSLHVPVINFDNTAYYWADLSYVPNTLDFVITNAGVVTDMSAFSSCSAATLSTDLRLHVPVITLGVASYWADFQYAHDLIFVVTGAGQN